MASVLAMALSSVGVQAASNQGMGTINFKGSVINSPCGIAQESADQSINFGQISKSQLEQDGISVKKNLDIKLIGCTFAPLNNAGQGAQQPQPLHPAVKVSFTGGTVAHNPNNPHELGTSGDTGTVIVVSSASGELVSFDGHEDAPISLQPGDNTLRYTAWVKKEAQGTLKEGDFSAVATFNLTYQ